MPQQPSVLIRVSGDTRDRLLTLRRRIGSYSFAPLEAIGEVVARLAAAAVKAQQAESPAPAPASTTRGRRQAARQLEGRG